LTFQNYRKTQIASRATRSQFSSNIHLNRKELLAKLTLTKNNRHFLKIKWFAIKYLKNSSFILLYVETKKMKTVCQTQLDTPPPPPPTQIMALSHVDVEGKQLVLTLRGIGVCKP